MAANLEESPLSLLPIWNGALGIAIATPEVVPRIVNLICVYEWWRRRESNPRPKKPSTESLHAFSGSFCLVIGT